MEIRDRPFQPRPRPAVQGTPVDRVEIGAARLPAGRTERSRALLNSMVSAPSPEVKRIVVDQLMAYGADAIEKVHNHGTQIVVVPKRQKPEEAWRELSLGEDNARNLKSDTGGLYDPMANRIFLREDMISDGLTAQRSAVINRHEFAHALASAIGGETPLDQAWKNVKKPVTAYAATNEAEYFAESVAGYLSPARDWSEKRTFGQALAWGLFETFQGFCIPTRETLQRRDAAGFEAVQRMLREMPQTPVCRFAYHGPDKEAWLWRAHQVDPSDDRIRIQLLTHRQKRSATPEQLERDVTAAYRRLQSRPLVKRTDYFKALDLYREQASRPLAGSEKARLDQEASALAPRLLQLDAQRQDATSRWNAAQDYDMVERELRDAGLTHAANAFREAQTSLMGAVPPSP